MSRDPNPPCINLCPDEAADHGWGYCERCWSSFSRAERRRIEKAAIKELDRRSKAGEFDDVMRRLDR